MLTIFLVELVVDVVRWFHDQWDIFVLIYGDVVVWFILVDVR